MGKAAGSRTLDPSGLFAMSEGEVRELGRSLVPHVVDPVVHRAAAWPHRTAVVLCRRCLPKVGFACALMDVELRPMSDRPGLLWGATVCHHCQRVHVMVASPKVPKPVAEVALAAAG